MSDLTNRYEIMALVEAKMCNPNGDPDMANRPRMDMQTGRSIITDVAFKARMRRYVLDAYNGVSGLDILMKPGASLNMAIAESVIDVNGGTPVKKGENRKVDEAASLMCSKYWDVRTFGAVLSTGLNAGQVRGAVQVGMSLSVDPVDAVVASITRQCYTEGSFSTVAEYVAADVARSDDAKRTMGDKAYIPYGLYVMKLTVSGNLARKVGFSEEDLKLLLESVVQMYNNDVSSSKMGMSVLTPVIVFKHVGTNHGVSPEQTLREALLGCAPAYRLFDLLSVTRKDGIDAARSHEDYNILLRLSDLPDGVVCGFKTLPFEDVKWLDVNDDIDLLEL